MVLLSYILSVYLLGENRRSNFTPFLLLVLNTSTGILLLVNLIPAKSELIYENYIINYEVDCPIRNY